MVDPGSQVPMDKLDLKANLAQVAKMAVLVTQDSKDHLVGLANVFLVLHHLAPTDHLVHLGHLEHLDNQDAMARTDLQELLALAVIKAATETMEVKETPELLVDLEIKDHQVDAINAPQPDWHLDTKSNDSFPIVMLTSVYNLFVSLSISRCFYFCRWL